MSGCSSSHPLQGPPFAPALGPTRLILLFIIDIMLSLPVLGNLRIQWPVWDPLIRDSESACIEHAAGSPPRRCRSCAASAATSGPAATDPWNQTRRRRCAAAGRRRRATDPLAPPPASPLPPVAPPPTSTPPPTALSHRRAPPAAGGDGSGPPGATALWGGVVPARIKGTMPAVVASQPTAVMAAPPTAPPPTVAAPRTAAVAFQVTTCWRLGPGARGLAGHSVRRPRRVRSGDWRRRWTASTP